jgi:Holliday junction resolvase RusA-like endonuclease
LLDALEHAGCYENDSQVDELHVIRQEVKKGGACTVIILPID